MDKHLNYYEVRWKNFKGYIDTGWIKIKPLTILLGPNNSGKTNFIAPFLLMQQTLSSRDPNSPLIVKGSSYDGGNIQELLNDYDLKKEIYFGFRYHIHAIDEPKSKLPKLGSRAPGSVEVTLGVEGHKIDGDIQIINETISDVFNRRFFSIDLSKKQGKKYILTGPLANKSLTKQERDAIKDCDPTNFIFTPNSLLSNLNQALKPHKEIGINRKKGYSLPFSNILDVMSYNFTRMLDYISDLSYIGPIRDHPHRVYELSNENYSTVGSKGENMANILLKRKTTIIKELEFWIKKFGFGETLKIEHRYANFYSLLFSDKKGLNQTNIANCGFGASQILPLIVQALVSEEDKLTIAEQPEIHLNPKLQGTLAELFAFMARKGQRVIVETHSEHLILRLRRLIAEGSISSDDVAIYFIEKVDGKSSIREIGIRKNGSINYNDWPKGFFEDALAESLAFASVQNKNNN